MKELENHIPKLYGESPEAIKYHKKRLRELFRKYTDKFSESDQLYFISTPGRTELSGNHTDHNGGKVIAASINLDSIAIFSKAGEEIIIQSDIYDDEFRVNLDLLNIDSSETGTTNALIRGIANGFVKIGYKIGGFKAFLSSDVKQGSGLSSSASIEVLIGSIINYLYNDNNIPPDQIAKIGQYAENTYFGKPCGLMDQLACAYGGIISIDFKDSNSPVINKLVFDLEKYGYKLLVLDTGGTHHNLTGDYAAIPLEMKQVAKYFNKSECSEIDLEMLLANFNDLRRTLSDRAILRAFHFISENEIVLKQIEALKDGDLETFLAYVKKSGDSSFKFLQNIYSVNNVDEQPLSLALAVSENFIDKIGGGACRVHGGGFAGTIQVFLPHKEVPEYVDKMERVFGKGSLSTLNIRSLGSFIRPIIGELSV